ncbi:hypothetical protein Avbf_05775 [Armadillidium vulgare]|nr:hypothetical protein Avbf_05775 [Armadillidium vulgare]
MTRDKSIFIGAILGFALLIFIPYLQFGIRPTMFVLLCSSIFPHYYSYWSFFNYWNDEFYKQFYHQLYFTITELISTAAVLYLLDRYCVTSLS